MTRLKSKPPSSPAPRTLTFHPATPERWPDIQRLFGPRGAVGGCWCMWWRISRAVFNQKKGEGNKRAFKRIIVKGDVPGILAYELLMI